MTVPSDDELLFVALGGAGEIGMNLNLYGTAGKWLMVDLGIGFADSSMAGVEVVMPDPAFIVERRDALVGMNAVVMDEAEVGAESIVAACAFVPAGMKLPARHLIAGMPAKVKRPLSDQEVAWKAEGTRVYQDLAVRSLQTMREVMPLSALEADRPRLPSNDVQPLIATKRG